MKTLFIRDLYPSCIIIIGRKRIPCHLSLMQYHSEYFAQHEPQPEYVLPEDKVDVLSFKRLQAWAIREDFIIPRKKVMELFRTAQFLKMGGFMDECWTCFDNEGYCKHDRAFKLYTEAEAAGVQCVKKLLLSRLRTFFLSAVATKDFLKMPAADVALMLSMNTIAINSEMEVFLTAVYWLSYDWPARQSSVLIVLKSVRFSLMPIIFLATLKKRQDCEVIYYLVRSRDVEQLICEGMENASVEVAFKKSKCQTPQREWIFDPESNYHHRLNCTCGYLISFSQFTNYIQRLRVLGLDHYRKLISSSEPEVSCCVVTTEKDDIIIP